MRHNCTLQFIIYDVLLIIHYVLGTGGLCPQSLGSALVVGVICCSPERAVGPGLEHRADLVQGRAPVQVHPSDVLLGTRGRDPVVPFLKPLVAP